jgi:hypothetical protein
MHRRYQNIRLPESMRDKPERTSVSRTVRDIYAVTDARYREIGVAVVYFREVMVATATGKYWVILEVETNVVS